MKDPEAAAPAPPAEQAPAIYDRRGKEFRQQHQQLQGQSARLSWMRGLTFVLAMIFAAAASDPGSRWVAAGLSIVLLLVFVVLCALQEGVWQRAAVARRLAQICENSAARWRRQWDRFPVPQVEVPREHLDTAADLDLFGRGSLFQLVCQAQTQSGRRVLRDWLLQGAAPELVAARQQSVEELAPQWQLRERFQREAIQVAEGQATPDSLANWCDEGADWAPLGWLLPLGWTLPLLFWLPLLLVLAGWLPTSWLAVAVVGAGACFLVALAIAAHAFATLSDISTSRGEVRQYSVLFDLIVRHDPESACLRQLAARLSDKQAGPAPQLRRLGRITWLSNLRRAGFVQSALYMICQVVLLIDVHLLAALQRWRRQNRGRVNGWFQELGTFESLVSLAGLAFDHPAWCRPQLQQQADRLTAIQIGHPLLAQQQRVCNDVEAGPPGTVLLVTGSNMSGKSTLLRSIGLNAVLAGAGGRVCAERFCLPPLLLATSIRVQDSLSDGVSFFMAELQRLKRIVDQARRPQQAEGRRLLYLLDEILQGTNSAERQIAVSHVLQHLLQADAIGAISTHDLELASLAELAPHCQTVHFRETLGADASANSMTFDYKLRQGVATTTNALKLLELVGLKNQ